MRPFVANVQRLLLPGGIRLIPKVPPRNSPDHCGDQTDGFLADAAVVMKKMAGTENYTLPDYAAVTCWCRTVSVGVAQPSSPAAGRNPLQGSRTY